MTIRKFIPVIVLLLFAGCEDESQTTTLTGTVGPEGGSLDMGNVTMNVPAGAVDQSHEIKVEVAENAPAGNIGQAYDIGPDGLQFSNPVTITISYSVGDIPSGVDESSLVLATTEGSQWRNIEGSTVNTTAHAVSGNVTHLSIYGVRSTTIEVPDDADTAPDAPPDIVEDDAVEDTIEDDISVDDIIVDGIVVDDIIVDDVVDDDVVEFCTLVSSDTDYETYCNYMWLCPDGNYYLIDCSLPRVGFECTCWVNDLPEGECTATVYGPPACGEENCCFPDLPIPAS